MQSSTANKPSSCISFLEVQMQTRQMLALTAPFLCRLLLWSSRRADCAPRG